SLQRLVYQSETEAEKAADAFTRTETLQQDSTQTSENLQTKALAYINTRLDFLKRKLNDIKRAMRKENVMTEQPAPDGYQAVKQEKEEEDDDIVEMMGVPEEDEESKKGELADDEDGGGDNEEEDENDAGSNEGIAEAVGKSIEDTFSKIVNAFQSEGSEGDAKEKSESEGKSVVEGEEDEYTKIDFRKKGEIQESNARKEDVGSQDGGGNGENLQNDSKSTKSIDKNPEVAGLLKQKEIDIQKATQESVTSATTNTPVDRKTSEKKEDVKSQSGQKVKDIVEMIEGTVYSAPSGPLPVEQFMAQTPDMTSSSEHSPSP
ncbi:hypothetical protein HDV05_007565, partial [Chytridiales sp. JEL 0842]